MTDGLIAGKLLGDPERRIGKGGKPFVVAAGSGPKPVFLSRSPLPKVDVQSRRAALDTKPT